MVSSGANSGGIRGGRPRLGGRISPARAPVEASLPSKKRVLFVCIGNSCRSQMAEAFARAYGADVLEAASAGLSPATIIQPQTIQVLSERNLRVDGQFPKGLEAVSRERFDLVVNMSAVKMGLPGARLIEWPVEDPIGHKEEVYRSVASQIETLVMRLILELRTEKTS
jgi:arsenate reductase